MGPWWMNAIAGIACLALGINFIAQAYGLRLGGKPWDISHLPVTDPRQVIDIVPLNTKSFRIPSDEETRQNNVPLAR